MITISKNEILPINIFLEAIKATKEEVVFTLNQQVQ